ncbi:MAG: PEGA domain-containing protein [Candidatus Omnitrophica bacterium]|nr:PEGA domain-containing protein [Candidatus Omnitrophota bacterium]
MPGADKAIIMITRNEQRIRAFLFYSSVAIFITGLPLILSFALGYKFDRRAFKFTRTGLLVLKTQPQGANIFLNETLFPAKTPATVTELLPGNYTVRLELEGHYPWINQAGISAGKVTFLEKIILFPLRPDIKQINSETLSTFWADEERGAIYYVNPDDGGIYKPDSEGRRSERVAESVPLDPPADKWKISPDREIVLYFNSRKIGITNISQQHKLFCRLPFVIDYPYKPIIDAYWHSDSYHLIIIGLRNIAVMEADSRSEPVILLSLAKKNTPSFYDTRTDTLYFLDTQRAEDGNLYDNLYKLDLNAKLSPFQELMRLRQSDEKRERED